MAIPTVANYRGRHMRTPGESQQISQTRSWTDRLSLICAVCKCWACALSGATVADSNDIMQLDPCSGGARTVVCARSQRSFGPPVWAPILNPQNSSSSISRSLQDRGPKCSDAVELGANSESLEKTVVLNALAVFNCPGAL